MCFLEVSPFNYSTSYKIFNWLAIQSKHPYYNNYLRTWSSYIENAEEYTVYFVEVQCLEVYLFTFSDDAIIEFL